MAMDYRRVGDSGLKVSPLCLGVMMFGGQTNAMEAGRIVDTARDAGVNFIDTANVYAGGESERCTSALVQRDREYWVIATKLANPFGPGPTSAAADERRSAVRSRSACVALARITSTSSTYTSMTRRRRSPKRSMRWGAKSPPAACSILLSPTSPAGASPRSYMPVNGWGFRGP